MTASSQTTNDLMMVFSNTISSGFAALNGPVSSIFGLMIALVVALTGLGWAISPNRDLLASAFAKILLIGFFAYLINDWQGLTETIFSGFLAIGLMAGGGSLSQSEFLNPGAIIETGWQIVKTIGEAPIAAENPADMAGHFIDAIIIGFAMLGIMLSFAILALQIIITLIEFKIVTLGGFILLPFGIFSKTAFMAERPLGYVVSSGLKVLALAMIVSGAHSVFSQLTPKPTADIYEALTLLTASMLLAMLAVFAPNMASSLITGGPSLGAGSAATGALTVAATSGAALATVSSFGASIRGGASSLAQAAKSASAPPPTQNPPSGGGAGSYNAGVNSGGAPTPQNPRAGSSHQPGSSSSSQSSSSQARASSHRFPDHARSPQGTKARAINAFFLANQARSFLPSNESSGSLNPNLHQED